MRKFILAVLAVVATFGGAAKADETSAMAAYGAANTISADYDTWGAQADCDMQVAIGLYGDANSHFGDVTGVMAPADRNDVTALLAAAHDAIYNTTDGANYWLGQSANEANAGLAKIFSAYAAMNQSPPQWFVVEGDSNQAYGYYTAAISYAGLSIDQSAYAIECIGLAQDILNGYPRP